MSLYTDRGSHYFQTSKAGEIDRDHPTQVGRALKAARGRAHCGLFAAGPRPVGAGVRHASGPAGQGAPPRRDHDRRGGQRLHPRRLPARLQRALCDRATGDGSAFTPIPGVHLAEILCVQEERQVGNDNCVSYRTLETDTYCPPTTNRGTDPLSVSSSMRRDGAHPPAIRLSRD